MTNPTRTDEQRLAFGRVAQLYDHARPSYPAEVIDAVLDYGHLQAPARLLEVGAGTGKATALLAERGFRVLAIEPSSEMAALARANCAPWRGVEIVECEFEQWRRGERVHAVISAQAWHWIESDARYERAGEALHPGGILAAIWTFPDWQSCALRAALSHAYRTAAPALAADFPMHPDSEPTRLAGDWKTEIAAAPFFDSAEVQTHAWSLPYSAGQYIDLLQTHQDHILLENGPRSQLLRAVAAAIEENGGILTMPFVTHACLASRAID
jgi:SAM-dependent methyltransferase